MTDVEKLKLENRRLRDEVYRLRRWLHFLHVEESEDGLSIRPADSTWVKFLREGGDELEG